MVRWRLTFLLLAAPVVFAEDDAARCIAVLRKQFPESPVFDGGVASDAERKANARTRLAALHGLARAGPSAALPAAAVLVRVMDASDKRSADLAGKILRGLGKDALPALLDGTHFAVMEGRYAHRKAIIRDLGEAAIPQLVEALSQDDGRFGGFGLAAALLVELGEPALPPLLERLKGAPAGERAGLAYVLGEVGAGSPEALAALRAALAGATPTDDERISVAIARLTPDRREAVSVLVAALGRQKPKFPSKPILVALGAEGARARDAIPLLVKVLAQAEHWRYDVLRCLWLVERDPGRILPELARQLVRNVPDRLGYRNRERVREALEFVAEMGAAARPLSPVVIDAMAGKADMLSFDRDTLPKALDATGVDPAVVPRMRFWLRTGSADAVIVAFDVLRRLGPHAAPALPEILQAAEHENARVRALAAAVLDKIAPEDLLEPLGAALETADERQACVLLERIGKYGPPAVLVLPSIRKAYRKSGGRARVFAMWTLTHFGPAAAPALPEVLDALQVDDAEIRYWAGRVVVKLGKDAAVAEPHLRKMLERPPAKDTVQAALALWWIKNNPDSPRHFGKALENAELQADALWGLGDTGKAARPYLPRIRQLLARGDGPAVAAAAYLVATLENDHTAAIAGLTRILEGSHQTGRAHALHAIRLLGAKMEPLRPLLRSIANDKHADPDEREAAVRALKAING